VARDLAAPKTGLASVQAAWSQAVGERIAEVAEPVSERSGTLTVECTNAMWAQELDLMQDQFLAKLREVLGEGAPEALKFRVARGS
jgi:predicted nucleic acid-binding Zn ribbon protein